MKKLFVFIVILIMSTVSFAQIEVLPENTSLVIKQEARLKTTSKPFWIGVGGLPAVHFDSSANRKVGIGSTYLSSSTTFGIRKFFEHAKVHIRHAGGPGSDFQNQKGPHLLLDEATADKAAAIRFRQSVIEPENAFSTVNKVTIGARYWDLRGFANGSSLNQDEFRIINSGATEDLLTIDGDGNFKLSGEGSTRLEIKGPAENNPVKFELGEIGSTSNGGRLWYNTATEKLQVFSGGVRGLEIDGNGFVQIGSGSEAPKIKTYFDTMVLTATTGVTTVSQPFPFDVDQIIGVDLTLINWNGALVGPHSRVNASFFNWRIDEDENGDVQLYIGTEDFVSNGVVGQTLKIYITYVE